MLPSSFHLSKILLTGTTRLLDGLLFGHLLLATAAASLTWATGQLLRQALPWQVSALVGAATLALYNFDGLVPYKRAQPATTRRGHWLRTHPRTLLLLALVGVIGAAPLALHLLLTAPRLLWLLLPLTVLAGLYSVPVLPGATGQPGVTPRRRPLRDVPALKGVLIAAVWAGLTVGLPALVLPTPVPSAALTVLLLRRFLWILTLTLVFDLRDVPKDRAAGTPTVPLLLGERRTKWLAYLLLTGLPWLLPPGLPKAASWLLLVPVLAAAALVAGARPERSDYYYAGLADGVLLLPAIAEWLV